MRHFTMYMDESGIASLANASDQYFVLTGLIIEDKTDIELSSYLRLIKRRHGIAEEVSLHAYDLFEDTHSPLYLSNNQKCKDFLSSIIEYVENSPFCVFVLYVDKKALLEKLGAPDGYSFKGSKKHKEDKDLPYEILARKLIFEFAKFLKKEKAIGSIIAESRRRADSVMLKAYIDTQEPQSFQGHEALRKLSEEARDRVNSIGFANKRSLKGGLELVDMVSYLSYNDITKKFPAQRNDRRGVKNAWAKIKEQIEAKSPQEVKMSEAMKVVPDRIDEISKRIRTRMDEFRDLVNPTRR